MAGKATVTSMRAQSEGHWLLVSRVKVCKDSAESAQPPAARFCDNNRVRRVRRESFRRYPSNPDRRGSFQVEGESCLGFSEVAFRRLHEISEWNGEAVSVGGRRLPCPAVHPLWRPGAGNQGNGDGQWRGSHVPGALARGLRSRAEISGRDPAAWHESGGPWHG